MYCGNMNPLASVSTTFYKCFYSLMETGRACTGILFLLENSVMKKRKQLVYFDHYACACSVFLLSYRNNFSTTIFFGLFSKY